MKKTLITSLLLVILFGIKAQITNPFFEHVSYMGAFDGTNNWTTGWANFNPDTVNYPATNIIVQDSISTNTTWTSSNVYELKGFVYLTQGTTLTIQAGTVIRGGNATASLIVEKGAKLIAQGTQNNPIIFTSNQPAGSRAAGDWGGVVLCGLAKNNIPGGSGTAEGGIRSTHGGTNDDDSSGVVSYVRIEYAGYAVQPNKELNGITFYSVGRKTKVDHVQVSFGNDDSFEWFGGCVNAKHIITFRGLDDDFDTDLGYTGNLQFGLVIRDPNIADISGSNAFESDNDASGSTATPKTTCTFSNFSIFGPLSTLSVSINSNYKRGMHFKKNTAINIYNTFIAGYPSGLCIDGSLTEANAQNNELKVEYTIIAGSKADKYFSIGAAGTTIQDSLNRIAAVRTYFLTPSRQNDTLATNDLLNVNDAFNLTAPNLQPKSNSVLLTKSYWNHVNINENTNNINSNIYPNPFTDIINIELNLDKKGYVQIDLYDFTGKKIQNLYSNIVYDNFLKINYDLKNVQTGIYFLRINFDNKVSLKKIIAQ